MTEKKERRKEFADNLSLLSAFRKGDVEAGNLLVEKNRPLVFALARRFSGRAELSDLLECGDIGLMKAIRTFDLSRGLAFSTYAVPLIFGEMRRFLRDDGLIKVSREEKRLAVLLSAETDRRSARGEDTSIAAVAAACGVSPSDAAAALFSGSAVRSLDEPVSTEEESVPLSAFVSDGNSESAQTERLALKDAVESLPPLWQKIVGLRYYHDCSQSKTAEILGLSQVKISREEKKILSFLKEKLA